MKNRKIKTIYILITAIVSVAAVTATSYAWFTANKTVTTSTVTSRTNNMNIELQISEKGGSAFEPVEVASITQVNKADKNFLIPVTTFDLESFLYNPATIEGEARKFISVTDEQFFYHGRIFLRAVGEETKPGDTMAVYLEQSEENEGSILKSSSVLLMSAARVGLVLNNDFENSVIFKFADQNTAAAGNTFLNGQHLDNDVVLILNGQGVTSVPDPSVSTDEYTIDIGEDNISIPDKALFYLEYNQIYPVDIYFYLEGCDPDANDRVTYDEAALHFSFYGIAP